MGFTANVLALFSFGNNIAGRSSFDVFVFNPYKPDGIATRNPERLLFTVWFQSPNL
jgi:hypothetical protein